jgi:hypothetical protein
MKHVGMNSHSKYQGNDMNGYRGLYYVNKGSYHHKKKFGDLRHQDKLPFDLDDIYRTLVQ